MMYVNLATRCMMHDLMMTSCHLINFMGQQSQQEKSKHCLIMKMQAKIALFGHLAPPTKLYTKHNADRII